MLPENRSGACSAVTHFLPPHDIQEQKAASEAVTHEYEFGMGNAKRGSASSLLRVLPNMGDGQIQLSDTLV